MPDLEAVIFDLGSTLIYFEGKWHEVLARGNQELLDHIKAAGVMLDGDKFLNQFKARLDEYYVQREAEFIEYTTRYILHTLLSEWGYPDVSEVVLETALESMYAVSEACWKVEEDAIPTLEQLRERGYRLGMISNAGDDANVQRLVDQAGIRPYFDAILSSAGSGIRKPNPRIFEIALNHLETPASRAVMVGDTLGADILGGHNAGMRAIWITRRADTPANREHLDTIQPDGTINTLSELTTVLETIEYRPGR
jgi:2-haloalkanoic acid dehalogenase type II